METKLSIWQNGVVVDCATISIEWTDESLGFGEISIPFMNGRYFLDSENLNKETVKKIVCGLIDQMEFTDGIV